MSYDAAKCTFTSHARLRDVFKNQKSNDPDSKVNTTSRLIPHSAESGGMVLAERVVSYRHR